MLKCFLLLIALALVMPLSEVECRSYEFVELTIDAWVQSDGSVRTVEKRTARFDGTYRGMFQWIDTSKGIGVTDVAIEERGVPYKRHLATNPGPPGTFFVRTDPDSVYVDWSFEATDETRTFTIKYTLTNAVAVHTDLAELYMQFIGDQWEASVDRVQVTLHLPDGGSDSVRAWGHGPLAGEVSILGPDAVVWQVSPLPANTFLEGRVTFPPALVPEAENRTGRPALQSILREEERWAREANRKRTRDVVDLSIGLTSVLVAIGLVLWRLYRWGKEYTPRFQGEYQRELPKDYSPAVMSVLYTFGNTGPRDLTATLLDLARRGYLAIEAGETHRGFLGMGERQDYRIIRKDDPVEGQSLTAHEDELLRFLFSTVDKEHDNEITFQEIQAYARRKKESFAAFWREWQEMVRDEAEQFHFFDEITVAKRNRQLGVGALVVAVAVASFFLKFIFAGIGLVIAGIILLLGAAGLRRRSESGCDEYAQWKAFRRFLLHFSEMQRHEVASLVIWEHYLVYAVSLGVARQVLKQLQLVFPDLEQDGRRFGHGWYHYRALGAVNAFDESLSSLTSSMESSFREAITTATSKSSSGSGSGGGFSGGGGGGVGGGGGGVR